MTDQKKANKRKSIHVHIETQSDIKRAVRLVEEIPTDGTMVVYINPDDELRTTKQRKLQQVWYTQIANEEQTKNSKKGVECYCKLTFGVPILMRDNPGFAERWTKIANHFMYEEQIKFMIDFPVTRLFGVRQNIEYLTEMELHYQDEGVVLRNKDDLYWESIGYSRRK